MCLNIVSIHVIMSSPLKKKYAKLLSRHLIHFEKKNITNSGTLFKLVDSAVFCKY